jgi:hypothetical protein
VCGCGRLIRSLSDNCALRHDYCRRRLEFNPPSPQKNPRVQSRVRMKRAARRTPGLRAVKRNPVQQALISIRCLLETGATPAQGVGSNPAHD